MSVNSRSDDMVRHENAVETAVKISLLGLLLYWSWTVISPFVTIFIWSAILTVALYPLYERLAQGVGRKASAGLITIMSILVVIGPVLWLGFGLIAGLGYVVNELQADIVIPPPGEGVRRWPLVGEQIYTLWSKAASDDLKAVLLDVAPKLRPVAGKVASIAESAIEGLFQFLLSIVISGFLFAPGLRMVHVLDMTMERILQPRGHDVVRLAGATVRNVSRGVLGVALLQALLAGLGFLLAGIRGPGLLAFLALILGIIQVGPSILIIPVVIWSWTTMDTLHAALFTAYMLPVSLLDNVLRPILMARGLTTPMPVIIVGVIGGTLSHGIIGLFFGPVITSVAWTLISTWIESGRDDAVEPASSPSTDQTSHPLASDKRGLHQ